MPDQSLEHGVRNIPIGLELLNVLANRRSALKNVENVSKWVPNSMTEYEIKVFSQRVRADFAYSPNSPDHLIVLNESLADVKAQKVVRNLGSICIRVGDFTTADSCLRTLDGMDLTLTPAFGVYFASLISQKARVELLRRELESSLR